MIKIKSFGEALKQQLSLNFLGGGGSGGRVISPQKLKGSQ